MNRPFKHVGGRARQRGLTLIEVMIAMLLGLVVVGSAIGIFLSNQRAYRATESLARVQEGARAAFELMAREVREAGATPCANNLPLANVLVDSSWWNNWGNGVVGYDGGALAASAGNTDAIEVLFATSGNTAVSETPSATAANFKVNTTAHGFEEGDILLICDYSQASIFEVTAANPSNVTIGHNKGGSGGNCTKGLGLPVVCSANGTPKVYAPNSPVAKLHATRWYVGDNGRGGRSLFRARMDKGAVGAPEEVVDGVVDMQIQYLVRGEDNYVDGAAGTDWANVTAIRFELSIEGPGREGTDGQPLRRDISHVVNLRNRTS